MQVVTNVSVRHVLILLTVQVDTECGLIKAAAQVCDVKTERLK